MTALLSGGEFEARLDAWLRINGPRPCTVLVVGINRFRRINHLLGHAAGDLALEEVARRLQAWLPAEGWLARLGGDEFAVALAGCGKVEAFGAAESMLATLEDPVSIHLHEFRLTAGLGFSTYPGGGLTAPMLMRQACSALRRAKLRGGKAIEWNVRPETTLPEDGFRLESAMCGAMERGELSLRYQPQVDREGQLRGVEALVVWNSAQLGHVDTETFIRLAEETGAIVEIGQWVLESACRQLADWRAAGFPAPRVAVNVSVQQFNSPDFLALVERALRTAGIGGGSLELEITENSVLADLDESARRMGKLRQLGVRIAIDDFGVGYSPLTYLHRLPLDALKVDRSFVWDITQPSGSLPVVHTITVLAHHRGLEVVAEGVETEAQLELVRAARCDLAQGFLIGSPVSGDEMLSIVRSQGQEPRRAQARSAAQY